MRRSQRDADKAMRKVKAALASGPSCAGPSLLESLESMLEDACRRYIELKQSDCTGVQIAMKRGQINGLAQSVAKTRLPYEDQKVVTKQVEKEFIRKAKE